MINNIASNWWKNLMPRERSGYDLEDAITVVTIELLEKDDKYDYVHKYTTWASMLATRRLAEERNYIRTVHAPRNSSGRLKVLLEGSATADAILMAMREPMSIEGHTDAHKAKTAEADVQHQTKETASADVESVRLAISRLPNWKHKVVLGKLYGLFGYPVCKAHEIADDHEWTVSQVTAIKVEAEREVRESLTNFELAFSINEDADEADHSEVK